MDSKIRQNDWRRYVGKKMQRKRKYRLCIKIFLICVVIYAGVVIVGVGKQTESERGTEKMDQVAAAELAGYLQAACLTPEETRKLVLPKTHDLLTGEDVQNMLQKIGMENSWDDFVALLKKNEVNPEKVLLTKETEGDFEEEVLQQNLTRKTWCQFYEMLLDKLQVKESVDEVKLQYLGKVPGEQRIIADNGNYDCDLQSCRMEYGKEYVVYVQKNLILGIKCECSQKNDGRAENAVNDEKTENIEQENNTASIMIPQKVRVLLSQDHGQNPERQSVCLTGNSMWKLSGNTGETEQFFAANEVSDCGVWMKAHGVSEVTAEAVDDGKLYLVDASGTGKNAYDGVLHIYQKEGMDIYWVVNELGMEAYLYGVVPGEMPASFAPEALKAQAVCARTYAALQVLGTSYEQYHADVDDTTACQVYLPENANQAATDAVNATAGQILTFQGMIASVYYFSTSCGYTAGLEVWQQEPVSYLGKNSLVTDADIPGDMDAFLQNWQLTAYDSESRFFRWKAVLQTESGDGKLLQNIQAVADQKDGKIFLTDKSGAQTQDTSAFGACTEISIANRTESGCVTDLCLNFSGGTAHIYNENAIRKILWSNCVSLTDKNGNRADTLTMLPSAFFSLRVSENGRYEVFGGGLGHGIGMSQYGADGMAKKGMIYADILEKFFPGTVLYAK